MIKQPRNAHQWNEFQTYWKGVEGIESVILGDFSTFAGDISGLVQIQEALISQHPEEAISVARHQRLLRLPCFYPWHSITVTWRGEAVPCCRDHNGALVLGDLTKQSLESVWNGPAMQDLRRQFKTARVTAAPCSTCKERSNEIGLPGRYYPFSLVNARRALAKAAGQSFP
jgi:radical SAM protein with 4Fe4S-binding SPASM domain